MHAACEGGKCQWSTTWHTNKSWKRISEFSIIWKFVKKVHDHKYYDRTKIIPVKCNAVVGIKLPLKISQILAQTNYVLILGPNHFLKPSPSTH